MNTMTKLALGLMGRLRPAPPKGEAATAIALPPPAKSGGLPLMEALAKRQSAREFAREALPLQMLSDLLWAAYGVNRAGGGRTAPSALNCQEVDVFVALPQGATGSGDITTLGRGGSDTTAVALAAALDIETQGGVCEIYTDVDGVYTADPRKVPGARKITRISYEEMLELASLGAGVMHNRAVMFGQKYGVPIHVRHSMKPDEGTMIIRETPDMEDIAVVGCALKQDLGRISLRRVPNRPGTQAAIFRHIADASVVVDDIMQTEYGDTANISFTVDHADLADVKLAAGKALEEIGTGELAIEIGLAKVSAVGAGMRTHTGVASTMFDALGRAGIPINNITTSEIKISCILPMQHGERALQVVHDAFGLGERG